MKITHVLRLPRSAVKGAADMLKQNENQIVDMNFHDAQKGKINLPIMRQNLYMQLKSKINSCESLLDSKTRIEGPWGRIECRGKHTDTACGKGYLSCHVSGDDWSHFARFAM